MNFHLYYLHQVLEAESAHQKAQILQDMLLNKFHEAFPENEDIPKFKTVEVWMLLTQLKTNKSTIKGDISVIIFMKFVAHITKPLTHVCNTSLVQGEYPKINKY